MSATITSSTAMKSPPEGGPVGAPNVRGTVPLSGMIAGGVCVAIALYHIASSIQLFAFMGFFLEGQVQAAISLLCAFVAVFMIHGGKKQTARPLWLWGIDAVLTVAALYGLWVVIFDYEQILLYSMYGSLDQKGVITALCVVIPLLEGLRRKTGIILPIIILSLVGIVVFQQYMPGLLYGRGYSLDRLLYSSYIGSNGIFGLPLHVAAEIILVFIIFGALISTSGAGEWFLDLALVMTGKQTGGPAKSAVVASALFGSVSGSPSANAASTGVLTIPLMKRAGYTPAFAAAVEAVASTGGQILPPVMGAIAFVMAEWTGNSYATIVKVATIPAILYILILYSSVHFQAKRQGIAKIDVSHLPPLWIAFKQGWYYLLPLLVLCWGLFAAHLPAEMAATLSFPVIIAVSFFNKDRSKWLTPRRIADGLIDSVHGWKNIAIITGSVGIMVGAMDLSGVGLKISDFIIALSDGNLIITLLLIGVAALILGMGLDAIPAYVTLATLLAPALIKLGVPVLSAHFFVVYWGLASFFTPPMCIAVFVTTSIAGSGIWQTGWESVRLGLGAFLVPFAFVLEPALLLNGSVDTIILATTTALIGAVVLSAALRGYFVAPLGVVGRIILGAAGILFIAPGIVLPLIGAATAGAIMLVQKYVPTLPLINERPALASP